jgi:hypothetical protein
MLLELDRQAFEVRARDLASGPKGRACARARLARAPDAERELPALRRRAQSGLEPGRDRALGRAHEMPPRPTARSAVGKIPFRRARRIALHGGANSAPARQASLAGLRARDRRRTS